MLIACEPFSTYVIITKYLLKDLITLLNFNLVDKDRRRLYLGSCIKACISRLEGPIHFCSLSKVTHLKMAILVTY
jgi:hypothetical protein